MKKLVFILLIVFLFGKISFSQVTFFADMGYSYFTAPDTSINSHAITLTPRLNVGLSKTTSISVSSEISVGAQIGDFIGSTSDYLTLSVPILFSYNSGIGASRPKQGISTIAVTDKSKFGYFFGAGLGLNRMKKEMPSDTYSIWIKTTLENRAVGAYISTGIRLKAGFSSIGLRFNILYPFIKSEKYATKIVYGTGLFFTF